MWATIPARRGSDASCQTTRETVIGSVGTADVDLDQLRKDIVFSESLRGIRLDYHTTWGLFSPRSIDEGTRLLLDHVEIASNEDSIDLGCGYGPIGLTLARLAPHGQAVLIDKDFVAIDYARKNAERNGINNTEIFLSNGFAQVEQRTFDVVVSNLRCST